MTKLSVNINKIATLRNARGGNMPDVVKAASDCEKFGAQGITVHPRPDERHIRYSDIPAIKAVINTEFNIEGNPIPKFMDLVLKVRPAQATLVPDAEKVGILYCSAEPNSEYQAKLFAEALEEDGIDYAEYTAADSNEIQSVTTTAVAECDVLYIPTDNTMASNTELINNVCEPAGVPVIAGEQGICSGCGIATLSISYYDIGYKAGEMAYDILVNGADVATMEIESAPNVTKMYNPVLCESLGITVPEGYEAIEG